MAGQKFSSISKNVLHAGALEMVYDSGSLQYITGGGEELLRRVYVALRDVEWGTFSPFIFNEKTTRSKDGFTISYDCQYKINEKPVFRWAVLIEGNGRNEISFSIHGLALASFKKNRAGLCILHPVKSCSGQTCEITTPEGESRQLSFPNLIAPHQPFTNIKKMQWTTRQNNTCEIIFEGDVFETEDQRNWTDASFKTYSTPLNLPFPVQLKAGDTIYQKVIFSVFPEKKMISIQPIAQHPFVLAFDETKPLAFPDIGSSQSLEQRIINKKQWTWLRKLQLDHYRIDIRLYDNTWLNRLNRGIIEARLLETRLEIALHMNGENSLNNFIAFVSDHSDMIKKILLLGSSKITDESILKKYIPAFNEAIPGLKVGGGTDCYFAELNRNILDAAYLDFVSFSINPQVHAFDNMTLLENMEAQYDAVISAKKLYPHLPVHVSPVTLNPRFNPDSGEEYLSGNMPPCNLPDPRQQTLFAAGWTLGSLRYLVAAEVASITYYEIIGKKGIIPASSDPSRITLSPVYLLLCLIMEFKKGEIFYGICNDIAKYTGIFISQGDNRRWIIANHTAQLLQIEVTNIVGESKLRELNGHNIDNYICNPLSINNAKRTSIRSNAILLNRYSIVIIDQ